MAKRRARYRRGRRGKKHGFASWSIWKKMAAILGGTFTLVLAAGAVLVASKLSKIETVKLDTDKLNISEAPAEERGTGYLNVALFGLDSRDNQLGKGNRTDTIIIASLNRETLEVKLSSVYRDTLLQLPDGSLNKANAAYSFGGPEDAIAMLNKNLDMDIQHYVAVNFNAMVEVIDALGGLDLDITEEEIPYVNGYATEIIKVTGKDSAGVLEPGLQHVSGTVATAYARIRYTEGGDFKRAERQRLVLSKIVEKAQNASLSQINKIIDKVFPMISTNFTLTEVLTYAKDAMEYKLMEMSGFPEDNTTDMLNNVGSVVIPVTLETNVVKLHQFLFGADVVYTPSSDVYTIGNAIAEKAGDRSSGTDNSSDYDEEESYDYNYDDYSDNYDDYDSDYNSDDYYDSDYSYEEEYDDSGY